MRTLIVISVEADPAVDLEMNIEKASPNDPLKALTAEATTKAECG